MGNDGAGLQPFRDQRENVEVGGIAGQDRIGRHHGFQLHVEGTLDVGAFYHGLDHECRALHGFRQGGDAGHRVRQAFLVPGSVGLAGRGERGERGGHQAGRALQRFGIVVGQADLMAAKGKDQAEGVA